VEAALGRESACSYSSEDTTGMSHAPSRIQPATHWPALRRQFAATYQRKSTKIWVSSHFSSGALGLQRDL
jgi:hypothetical protein